MSGIILEQISNRKVVILFTILLAIQIFCTLIGGIFAPPPTNTEQLLGVKCHAEDVGKLSIPRVHLPSGGIVQENCKISHRENSGATVFAFQMPLPREGFQLDYSRWMSSLLAVINPEITFHDFLAVEKGVDQKIQATLIFRVRLAARNRHSKSWTLYAERNKLYRTIDCRISASKMKNGNSYDCEPIMLFELQSVFYDYYLVNLEILGELHGKRFSGQLHDINMVVIHQNGGFTQVWLLLKSFFVLMSGFCLAFFIYRIYQTQQPASLVDRFLIILGISLFQMNMPIEYLSLYYDLPFMNILNDVRQGIFYCILLSFWIVLVGEHIPKDGPERRASLSVYHVDLFIVLTGSVSMFVFDSAERGAQTFDPFFTMWQMESFVPNMLLFIALLCVCLYLLYLIIKIRNVFKSLSTRENSFPRMASARRMAYHGVIYRFKFVMFATLACASLTCLMIFYTHFREYRSLGDDYMIFSGLEITPTSAMFAGVYAVWNCYVCKLLILFAPSAKGLGVDNLEEELEFTCLDGNEEDALNEETPKTSRIKRSKKNIYVNHSELHMLQELTSKPNFE